MRRVLLEPFFWALFGAGGMLAAFLMPILVLLLGVLLPLGWVQLDYPTMHHFAASWIGKGFVVAIIALPLWHAAHRIYHSLHDLGIHGPQTGFRVLCYGTAAAGSLAAVIGVF